MSDASTEAVDLVNGERQKRYGSPWDNFCRNALIWMGQTGVWITPEQVAQMMVGVKLGRGVHSPDFADHWIDTHGYANTWEMVVARRAGLVAQYFADGAESLTAIDRLFIEHGLAQAGELQCVSTSFIRAAEMQIEGAEQCIFAQRNSIISLESRLKLTASAEEKIAALEEENVELRKRIADGATTVEDGIVSDAVGEAIRLKQANRRLESQLAQDESLRKNLTSEIEAQYAEIAERDLRNAKAAAEITRLRDNSLADDEERIALNTKIRRLENALATERDEPVPHLEDQYVEEAPLLFDGPVRIPGRVGELPDGQVAVIRRNHVELCPTAGTARREEGPTYREETLFQLADLMGSLERGYAAESLGGGRLFADLGERFRRELFFEEDMLRKTAMGWNSFIAPHAGALTPKELATVLGLYYRVEARVVEDCMVIIKGLNALADRLGMVIPNNEEAATNDAK